LRSFIKVGLVSSLLLTGSGANSAESVFDRLIPFEKNSYSILATGFVTDDSHPMHAGYFRKNDISLRMFYNPELGEAALEFEYEEDGKTSTDKYFVRRGKVFQIDDKGEEKKAEDFGDLSWATIAGLHPEIVVSAILDRRENLEPDHADGFLFAWNDDLWSVAIDKKTGQINSLHRRIHHDVHGDGTENIHFDGRVPGENINHPASVSIDLAGREIARFNFEAAERGTEYEFPTGERYFDHNQFISESEIKFTQLAPNIYCTELASINTRVFVAEFIDFLVVLEGAYNSRNCDMIAQKVQERFQKPVKYFAFSHLHGQYIGGTRSWVEQGATVIVPPTTVKLVEEMVNNPNDLEPDALSRNPKPLNITTAKEGRRIDDAVNALEIYNVESEHTDEYFIFFFPRQKVLLTGDLLFYRPAQTPPLRGRSVKLCETVQKLGLDVDIYVPTWPLIGYDTKNIVTKAEMQEGCDKSK